MTDERPASRDLEAEFEASYTAPPPWDIGRPQPAFAELARDGRVGPTLLDAGCGTGEHVLMAAAAGCDALGIDIAPSAIRLAEAKRDERGVEARFLVGDARRLHELDQQFDTVLDCGLFHVFDDEDRPRYAASLATALRPGGRFHVLCFSDDEPPGWGPRRVTQAEIRSVFDAGWEVEAIEPTELHVTIRPEPVRAWFATIRRG